MAGLRRTEMAVTSWPDRATDWLRSRGLLEVPDWPGHLEDSAHFPFLCRPRSQCTRGPVKNFRGSGSASADARRGGRTDQAGFGPIPLLGGLPDSSLSSPAFTLSLLNPRRS